MTVKGFSLYICLALCFGVAAVAQTPADTVVKPNNLDIGLNIMLHGETRHGGLPRSDDESGVEQQPKNSANFLLERTRLSIDYSRDIIQARVMAQNQAIWGAKGNTTLSLYEAWAKLRYRGAFLQVGRMPLVYDDERILGANDWSMAGKSHDLMRIGYEGHGHKVHALLAYNQNPENINGGSFYKDGAQIYKTMHTLWYHYDLPRIPLGASLLVMNIGMQGGVDAGEVRTRYQQLIGAYARFTPKHWEAEASYYRQMGQDEGGITIKAWMMAFKGDYHPTTRYGFTAGYDYLSGDPYFAVPPHGGVGMTRHDVIKGFNPIYGSHHKFYGAMDFFYVTTYVNGFSPGLQNAYFGAYIRPVDRLQLGLKGHYLAMATKLPDVDRTLGYEFEFDLSLQIIRDVKFTAGYTYMKGSKTMAFLKRTSGDGHLHWGWFSLTFSPKIFSFKW